jgi:hypothetical protein
MNQAYISGLIAGLSVAGVTCLLAGFCMLPTTDSGSGMVKFMGSVFFIPVILLSIGLLQNKGGQ